MGRLAVGLCNHLPQGPETHSIRLQPLGLAWLRRENFWKARGILRCCVLYNSNNGLLGDALGDHDVQSGLQLSEAATGCVCTILPCYCRDAGMSHEDPRQRGLGQFVS